MYYTHYTLYGEKNEYMVNFQIVYLVGISEEYGNGGPWKMTPNSLLEIIRENVQQNQKKSLILKAKTTAFIYRLMYISLLTQRNLCDLIK